MVLKIRPWITRELTAILGLPDVSVLTELVISLVSKHAIRSLEVHQALGEFLGEDVEVFIHELVCFACSSHKDIASYDKYVRYDKVVTTYSLAHFLFFSFLLFIHFLFFFIYYNCSCPWSSDSDSKIQNNIRPLNIIGNS